jgi:hypothetical protein
MRDQTWTFGEHSEVVPTTLGSSLALIFAPSSRATSGADQYPDSAAPSMLKAFADLNRDKNFDEYAALMQSHAYAPGMGFLAVANIQYTKAVENPKTFQAYPKLQPQYSNTMRISNQTDFTDEFIVTQPSGRR